MIEKSALRKVPTSSFFHPNSCSAVIAQRGYSSVTNQKAFFQHLGRGREGEAGAGKDGREGRGRWCWAGAERRGACWRRKHGGASSRQQPWGRRGPNALLQCSHSPHSRGPSPSSCSIAPPDLQPLQPAHHAARGGAIHAPLPPRVQPPQRQLSAIVGRHASAHAHKGQHHLEDVNHIEAAAAKEALCRRTGRQRQAASGGRVSCAVWLPHQRRQPARGCQPVLTGAPCSRGPHGGSSRRWSALSLPGANMEKPALRISNQPSAVLVAVGHITS